MTALSGVISNMKFKAILVIYDYFLTLPLEISKIWKGSLTIGKVLFMLCRYPSFLCQLVIMLLYFRHPLVCAFQVIYIECKITLFAGVRIILFFFSRHNGLTIILYQMQYHLLYLCSKFGAYFCCNIWQVCSTVFDAMIN